MCDCNNVEIGSYNNQVELKAPKWSSHKTICVDACLTQEITKLWSYGVHTTGCCCGHNKNSSFINVSRDSECLMLKLGYTPWVNAFNVMCFKPKTKL